MDSRKYEKYEKYKSSTIMHQIFDNLYKYLTVNFSDQEIPGNRYSSELTLHNVWGKNWGSPNRSIYYPRQIWRSETSWKGLKNEILCILYV